MSPGGPAADRDAPYVRLAVVGLIQRTGEGEAARGAPVGRGRHMGAESLWLLLHRTQPFEAWDPPGGRVEAGEDLVQAVKREVEEEAGLAVDVAGPCYAFLTFYKGERLLAVSMACRPAGDPDDIRLEPDGTDGWRWVTGAQWEDLAVGRLTSWALNDVKKAIGSVAAVWEAEEA